MRNSLRTLIAAIALVALTAAASHAAVFRSWTNYLRFNTAIALPGVALPAGVYTFEVLNPGMDADVVRVSSRDGRRIYFTGFTRRVPRPARLPKDRLVVFGEARRGEPQPIAIWFPIDSSTGHQFVY